MNRFKYFLFVLLSATCWTFTGCVEEDHLVDTPRSNLLALWKAVDEHYCFFEEKRSLYGLDWDAVRVDYLSRVNDKVSQEQLFEVCAEMLSELKDGHVNLYSTFDIGRYWSWYTAYPSQINEDVVQNYLQNDYRIASGMNYKILDDNIGYLRCTTFTNGMSEAGLDAILLHFAPCQGLIIDLRNNPGGQLTSAEQLAARFTNKKLLVGYMQHKTGPAHNAFSERQTQYLQPSNGIRWQKPVVVLTNRKVFSAANEFVKYMKECPLVTVVGDHTGGGAGLPFNYDLPNGWKIRMSACPMFDVNGETTEHGIEPDVLVGLEQSDVQKGKDTLIEYARKHLSDKAHEMAQ